MAKPAVKKTVDDASITFRLTSKAKSRITRAAKKSKVSVGQYIKAAVEYAIKLDLAKAQVADKA